MFLYYHWQDSPSFPMYQVSTWGQIRNKRTKTVISQHKILGYYNVSLYKFPGQRSEDKRPARVGFLVLEAFVGPRPEGMEVDHIDKDNLNDSLSNLRWATKPDQGRNRKKYENPNMWKPVVKRDAKTGKEIDRYESGKEAAKENGVKPDNISKWIKFGTLGLGFKWEKAPTDPDLPGEEWRVPPKKDGSQHDEDPYKRASNYGRVWYMKLGRKKTGEEMSTEQAIEQDRYPRVWVGDEQWDLHKLIEATFPEYFQGDKVINHINHKKRDASLENLESVTRSENGWKAHEAGRYDGKKSVAQAIEIDGISYRSMQEASRTLGIPHPTVVNRVKSASFPNYVRK